MLRKLIAAACFALLACAAAPSYAQPVKVVATCGVVSPAFSTTLTSGLITMDVNGNLCTAASVSASITGFPTVQSTGTPISVTTSSATGTLPTGAVVVASNVGATNGAYCKLGATATTSDQLIPPNSWFAFTVGANTQLSCITSTSTTTVNMVGGSGLPTGSGGGGGGGGGGGAVTVADGADVTQGANADAAVAAGAAGSLSAKMRRLTTDIDSIKTLAAAATPAGTNTIGTTGSLPYPVGAVPYTATATGTTAATTAILAGAASVTTYICGFSIRANATAAATGNATVTGVITATLNFTQWTAPNASGLGVTEMIFSPCIPASAANTSVAVVSAAPGTGGVVSVTAWGYKL